MDKNILECVIERGMTQRGIADKLGVSQATVKWWLKKHNLKTKLAVTLEHNGDIFLKNTGKRRVIAICHRHGEGIFIRKKQGQYRCKKCDWIENYSRRTYNRNVLIKEHGGKCIRCGFNNPLALDFHHKDKALKSFSISFRAFRSLENLRLEAAKCELLCANCHRIVEHQLRIFGPFA